MPAAFTFDPPPDDPLGVLSSTAAPARDNSWVRIDPAAVQRFAEAHREAPPPVNAEDPLHCTFLPPRRFLNYLLALEAVNFCFWDDEPRWRVHHRGAAHDGYWALAAALHRAVADEAVPLWDAQWLASVDEVRLGRLLRGEGRPPPLLAERTAHLREAGRVLLERWDGAFANMVEQAAGDAAALVRLIETAFPSFRDEATWQGRPVRFLKRAQICVGDLARMLPDPPGGPLRGLERLTAFADYKVPQVLRREGMLVYAPALAERLERGEPLPPGSPEEVAIRAATVWVCEWAARALRALGVPATAMDVDYRLWSAGQHKAGLRPYHRTRTVYY